MTDFRKKARSPVNDKRDFRKRTHDKSPRTAPDEPAAPRLGSPTAQPAVWLRPGREKSLQRRHPWIFTGAVAQIDGKPASGSTVAIRTAEGDFLAWAAYSTGSQICARVWSWFQDEIIDQNFFTQRIAQAVAARSRLALEQDSTGMRLVHGESDGLPGLIVDQYGEVLVMQLGSAGAEFWRDELVAALREVCRPTCIYERSDSDGRELEGLPKRCGPVYGDLPSELVITEHGIRFAIDVGGGQKTGFYLDQRENRLYTGSLARDQDVLNCFCYTGGFSLYALRNGARSVLSIDASESALETARHNVELNALDAAKADWLCADVFEALRKLRDQGRSFDLIVLDPPKFAPTASFAEKAARAYKDINLLGFKLLRPGGLLFTYSCSGGINDELFQKIIAGAALDAGVDARIVKKLHATADHPVLLSFPEGAYLKGLVLQITP